MTRTLLVALLLAAAVQPAPAEVEAMVSAYGIRPTAGRLPFALRRIYVRDREKGGTPFFAATSLADFLAIAMKVDRRRVFGPAWIFESRYEVYFRTKQRTSVISTVLKALLIEKFHLRYRKGKLATAVPVLSTPRGEPRRKGSQAGACGWGRPGGAVIAPDTGGGPQPLNDTESAVAAARQAVTIPNLDFSGLLFTGCRVADVIPPLEQYIGQVILDETTAQGRYKFTLELPNSPPAPERRLPALAWQLKQQLGAELRFEARLVEDALVIERATPLSHPVSFGDVR
ncbi:MAG: TIGR03435 family protein [Acidobacteriota bacterium]